MDKIYEQKEAKLMKADHKRKMVSLCQLDLAFCKI